MNKKILLSWIIQVLFVFSLVAKPQYQTDLFVPVKTPITSETIKTDPQSIAKAARYALQYFTSRSARYRMQTRSPLLDKHKISNLQARRTLEFIVKTVEEDEQAKRPTYRILDPAFIAKHFSFIKWNSDQLSAKKNRVRLPSWFNQGKLAPDKIKLTSYAIFKRYANYKKTKERPHALYQIISKPFEAVLRRKHTKAQVLRGALEKKAFKKHIKPLAWVSRQTLEEAMMQGSIMLLMPDGKKRIFNTYKSNGFPFDKKLKTTWKQKKYWFFKEIQEKPSQKYIYSPLTLGGAIFAGDINSLGLGKLIGLRYKNLQTKKFELRLGVLADRGSAFSNNLYQLDFFSGTFNNRREFRNFIKQFPPAVDAYVLQANISPRVTP